LSDKTAQFPRVGQEDFEQHGREAETQDISHCDTGLNYISRNRVSALNIGKKGQV
jgi:hypothetical protein